MGIRTITRTWICGDFNPFVRREDLGKKEEAVEIAQPQEVAERNTEKASGGGKKGKKGKKKDDDWYGGDGSFGCMFRLSDLTGRMKMM